METALGVCWMALGWFCVTMAFQHARAREPVAAWLTFIIGWLGVLLGMLYIFQVGIK